MPKTFSKLFPEPVHIEIGLAAFQQWSDVKLKQIALITMLENLPGTNHKWWVGMSNSSTYIITIPKTTPVGALLQKLDKLEIRYTRTTS